MEADHEATEEAVDELIQQLMQDLSRRRTEIYMQGMDFQDHIKLRDHADDSLTLIEKLQQEAHEITNDNKAEDKVDELIAANAATQATIYICDGRGKCEHQNFADTAVNSSGTTS